MLAKPSRGLSTGAVSSRKGSAAVEFCVCLPLLATLVLGVIEVGRMVEVQQVVYNSTREGARDASMGQANLSAVAQNITLYLQAAEPGAFGSGDSTSVISPVITVTAPNYGYTVWDNTANRELFTVVFTDITNSSITDPTGMSQLDVYSITVSYPVSGISWLPVTSVAGVTRLSATMTWACMVDSPYSISPYLPAQ